MKGLFVILCCLFFLSDKPSSSPVSGHCLLRTARFWLGDTGWNYFIAEPGAGRSMQNQEQSVHDYTGRAWQSLMDCIRQMPMAIFRC
jgi:hypothetical protein